MRKPAIGVFVIDDEEIVRTAFAGIFSRDARLKLVGAASCLDEATESVPKARPDVVVTEVLLPGSALVVRGLSPDASQTLNVGVIDESGRAQTFVEEIRKPFLYVVTLHRFFPPWLWFCEV
jgi:DNA-binding NarL/FixJ family response regulator